MADNLSRAREQLKGQREAIRDATRKWHRYTMDYEKEVQWKTIQNAQKHVQKLKESHPTLKNDTDAADAWRPKDRAL